MTNIKKYHWGPKSNVKRKKSLQKTFLTGEKHFEGAITGLSNLASVKFGPRAGRLDFYDYLAAVYGWVLAWNAKMPKRFRSLLAGHFDLSSARSNANPFHMVIRATSPRTKVTNSKFGIALENCARGKVPANELKAFLQDIGGPTKICVHSPDSVMRKMYATFKKSNSVRDLRD